MHEIIFPGANLKLSISQTAFEIFAIEIYWYAIIMVSAFIIALLICYKRNGLYKILFKDITDLAIYMFPISIISARIYYICFNDFGYYLSNPVTILNLRTGGLAIYGALIGGAITCAVFCKRRKINLLDLFDYIVPCVALGQALGRWGNFCNVEAYGTETLLPWRMGIIEAGKYIEVHPTFLYESLATFTIFIISLIMKNKRTFKGQLTCIYLIGYSLARMFIEGLRTDSLMVGSIRISQALSVILFIVFTAIYIWKRREVKGEENG